MKNTDFIEGIVVYAGKIIIYGTGVVLWGLRARLSDSMSLLLRNLNGFGLEQVMRRKLFLTTVDRGTSVPASSVK